MTNDLVSIIMLSRNKAPYVEESVRSVIAQTYTNWELLFVDDNSDDDTINLMMTLKEEGRLRLSDGRYIDRVKVSRTVVDRGVTNIRNSALREARGRWMTFLDVGDVWAPEKLERQIAFMEEHGYAFSYHRYGLMDSESKDRGMVVGGKEKVTHRDLLKCCWPSYLTVMYDAEKVGTMKVRTPHNNDYGLWLNVSDRHDCYLLNDNLASMRTKWGRLGKILLTNSIKWRYDAYRYDEDLGPVTSFLYTVRNGWYGIVKWMKYVEK